MQGRNYFLLKTLHPKSLHHYFTQQEFCSHKSIHDQPWPHNLGKHPYDVFLWKSKIFLFGTLSLLWRSQVMSHQERTHELWTSLHCKASSSKIDHYSALKWFIHFWQKNPFFQWTFSPLKIHWRQKKKNNNFFLHFIFWLER